MRLQRFTDPVYVCVGPDGELQTGYKTTAPRIYRSYLVAKNHCWKGFSVKVCHLTEVLPPSERTNEGS